MNKKLLKSFFIEAGFEILKNNKFMFAPVSFLPYLKINVNPKFSLQLDSVIYSLRIFNFLFVNQYIVGRKPVR